MKYSETNQDILLGDEVLLDHDVVGIVVCDYDSWTCLDGYESWLAKHLGEEGIIVKYLDKGILLKTEAIGFVHCNETSQIQPNKRDN